MGVIKIIACSNFLVRMTIFFKGLPEPNEAITQCWSSDSSTCVIGIKCYLILHSYFGSHNTTIVHPP